MSDKETASGEVVRIVAPLVILSVGAAGLFLFWQGREMPTRPAQEKTAPLVDTAPVAPYTDPLTIEVDGQVVPYIEVALSAEVAGRVVKKEEACRAGKFVREGDPLLLIDPSDYELAMRQLTEEKEQAGIAVNELVVDIENTGKLVVLAADQAELQEAEWRREQELIEASAGSRSAADRARVIYIQAESNLAILNKQISMLEAKKPRLESLLELIEIRLERAQLDLDRTRVKSPIDGMVVNESVEVNSFVQKGTPLVTIEDTSAIEVRCQLRMDELCWIWCQAAGEAALQPDALPPASARLEYQLPETPVTVVYRLAEQEYTWEGVLWRYDGIGLDERTRTVPCRVLVREPRRVQLRTSEGLSGSPAGPPALVRGMFTALEIHVRPKVDLLKIPEVAVRPGNRVWRVRNDQLHTVDVHVVEIVDDVAVLRATEDVLSAGDRVVVSPLAEATDGMIVRERSEATAEAPTAAEVAFSVEDRAR